MKTVCETFSFTNLLITTETFLMGFWFLMGLGHFLLLVNMRKARIRYTSVYDFCPKSIDIACEEEEFEIEKRQNQSNY